MRHNNSKLDLYQEILIEDFLDEYPNCEILANNSDCLLARHKVTKKAFYHYIVDSTENYGFTFHLLSEVGERYKQVFVDMINDLGLNIEEAETRNDAFETLNY